MSLPTPSIEYAQLSPMLIVFGAAVIGVLLEAVVPRHSRYRAQVTLSACALIAAFVAVLIVAGRHGVTAMGSVAVDGPALFLQGAILLIGIASLSVIAEHRLGTFTAHAAAVPGSDAERLAIRAGAVHTEVFPLTMFAVAGMLLFPAANDWLTMFIALEVFSMPLYLLCGLARHRRVLSQEAALKYFLLGTFSSAFFVFGVALLYGCTGTLALSAVAGAGSSGESAMALAGVALVSVGLLFKVGAVPFHSWIPDVYQGAPTAITGFMAAATKIAAFGAILRVYQVAFSGLVPDWRPALSAVAIATMVVATVLTVTQTDVKRLLAYSSVANVGFILTGVIAASDAGLSSTLFFLVGYGVSTVGAFAVVGMIRGDDGREYTDMSRWAGLAHRSPHAATLLAVFLLAMAGIPLTSGFVGKFGVFEAAMAAGGTILVGVGVVSSAIAAFAYARVIVVMFFTEPGTATPRAEFPGPVSATIVGLGAAVTVLLGIAPQPLLDLAHAAGQFLG